MRDQFEKQIDKVIVLAALGLFMGLMAPFHTDGQMMTFLQGGALTCLGALLGLVKASIGSSDSSSKATVEINK